MERNEVILLDTHCLLWRTNNDPLMGKQSRSMAEIAGAEGQLAISAISFWEIALLAAKNRLNLHQAAEILRRDLLDADVIELPLTGDIAILAVGLNIPHGDPADCFIVATAIAHNATLMTADRALLRWRNALPRQNAAK
jgi:PIN domain nuclease of toxin-antitoxin system